MNKTEIATAVDMEISIVRQALTDHMVEVDVATAHTVKDDLKIMKGQAIIYNQHHYHVALPLELVVEDV